MGSFYLPSRRATTGFLFQSTEFSKDLSLVYCLIGCHLRPVLRNTLIVQIIASGYKCRIIKVSTQ